jgi:hypothetical protein
MAKMRAWPMVVVLDVVPPRLGRACSMCDPGSRCYPVN